MPYLLQAMLLEPSQRGEYIDPGKSRNLTPARYMALMTSWVSEGGGGQGCRLRFAQGET